MKSMAILLLACLPLSILTVWSFVELGSVDEQLARPEMPRNIGVEKEPAQKVAAQVEHDKRLVRQLAEVDLLSGKGMQGLEVVSEQSSFRLLKETWPKWTAAHQMVAAFLETERFLPAADPAPGERPELKELQNARDQLQKLKQQHEHSPARGTGRFVTLLDRRIAGLDHQIARHENQAEAEKRWNDAQEAFRSAEYGDCTARCDELLSEYLSVIEPARIEAVRGLGKRAALWDEALRCSPRFKAAGTPTDRVDLLSGFLGRYTDRAFLTDAELGVLSDCEQELRKLKGQLELERMNREANEKIRRLEQTLPPRFDDRLRRTIPIRESYPTDTVKDTLRGKVEQWLQEFLPEKQIHEPPGLGEAETTKHEIVRGFFKEVITPDGTLFGYKRYPTEEALKKPAFDVGTYRREEFLILPGPSVPRQCVARYHEARNRLLADPSRRDVWVELAALCESLEGKLAEYRQKRGAAEEDRGLSFENEGRFAREFSTGPSWADLETLFRP